MFEFTNTHSLSGYSLFKTVLKPKISRKKFEELREYANSNGIYLENFKDYTGDIQEIKEFIDKIVLVSKDFPALITDKKSIRLGLCFKDIEYYPDFAYTERYMIKINGMMYNESIVAENTYKQAETTGHFVRGTCYKDVPYHELGHAVCDIYNLEPLLIAKEITNIQSEARLIQFLVDNLSTYSTVKNSEITNKYDYFDGCEIIAESFCAYYSGVKNQFAKDYVETCKKLVRR